jgi:hypothetical protein
LQAAAANAKKLSREEIKAMRRANDPNFKEREQGKGHYALLQGGMHCLGLAALHAARVVSSLTGLVHDMHPVAGCAGW